MKNIINFVRLHKGDFLLAEEELGTFLVLIQVFTFYFRVDNCSRGIFDTR
jgi:hypothetical protein